MGMTGLQHFKVGERVICIKSVNPHLYQEGDVVVVEDKEWFGFKKSFHINGHRFHGSDSLWETFSLGDDLSAFM